MLHINTQPAVKLAPRDKRELAEFNKKADEVLIKQGYSQESIDKLRVLYEIKVGAKNLDDVLKEKGKDFFKNKEFKELASKEGLGIGKNYQGKDVLKLDVKSGSKGAWNKELNNPKANRIYNVDDKKIYHTDAESRVVKARFKPEYGAADRNYYQQSKVGKSGNKGDEGGHLEPSILGGAGEKINLVPMHMKLNRKKWKKIENMWSNAKKLNQDVQVEIDISYEGNSKRPSSFVVTTWINGVAKENLIKNSPGGK